MLSVEELRGEAEVSAPDRSLGDEGCEDLVDKVLSNDVHSLTCLNLRGNHIRGRGAAALGRLLSSPVVGLHSLSLEWNSIGVTDEGVAALAEGVTKSKSLASLDLRSNKIGPRGAVALAKALSHTQAPLVRLDLRWNCIGQAGGSAITAAVQGSATITDLPLGGNNIRASDLAAIATALSRNRENLRAGPQDDDDGDDSGDDVEDVSADAAALAAAALAAAAATHTPVDARPRPSGGGADNEAAARHLSALQSRLDGTEVASDSLRAQLRVNLDELKDVRVRHLAECNAHSATQLRQEEAHKVHSSEREESAAQVEALRTEVTRAREARAVAEEARQQARAHAVARELREEAAMVASTDKVLELERQKTMDAEQLSRLDRQVKSLEEVGRLNEQRLKDEEEIRREAESRYEQSLADHQQRQNTLMEQMRGDASRREQQAESRAAAQSETTARLEEELKAAKEEAVRCRVETREALDQAQVARRQSELNAETASLERLSERLDLVNKARKELEARSNAQQERFAETQAKHEAQLSESEEWLVSERQSSADLRSKVQQLQVQNQSLETALMRHKQRATDAAAQEQDLESLVEAMRTSHQASMLKLDNEHVAELARANAANTNLSDRIGDMQALLDTSTLERRVLVDKHEQLTAALRVRIVHAVQACFATPTIVCDDSAPTSATAAPAASAAPVAPAAVFSAALETPTAPPVPAVADAALEAIEQKEAAHTAPPPAAVPAPVPAAAPETTATPPAPAVADAVLEPVEQNVAVHAASAVSSAPTFPAPVVQSAPAAVVSAAPEQLASLPVPTEVADVPEPIEKTGATLEATTCTDKSIEEPTAQDDTPDHASPQTDTPESVSKGSEEDEDANNASNVSSAVSELVCGDMDDRSFSSTTTTSSSHDDTF